ncbi:unnamed protein product [Closterium sp. NIES-65]|nr:unnamed protein product [Closterium sp. NIES-65]
MLSLIVRSLGVLSLEVLCLLEVLQLPCHGKSLSLHCSCTSGLLGVPAFRVALVELGGLPLETLPLEALELEALELLEQVVLLLLEVLLVPEVLVLEVLELPTLVVLLLLEVLEVLEVLELLVMEVLVMEVLELPELVVLLLLEVLELLELLVPEVLVLEVLELLELVVLQVLELETPEQEVLALGPASPLPDPSPYTEETDSLTERRQPASRPASLVRAGRTGRRVPRPRPPPVPGTHGMVLRPSSVPLRVPLPSPPASSLPDVPDPETDLVRAASPTVTRLLATVVTDPSFESTAASALVAELVDFGATSRLDFAATLVAESETVCPPSVGGECALATDVLEDRQEDFECLAAAVPHLVAMLLAPEGEPDALDIPTPRS